MMEEYLKIQNDLKNKIICKDKFDVTAIKTIGGVDLAYWKKDNKEYAVCCIVVIEINTHKVLEKQHFSGEITVPYMPGFLSFREFPLIYETAKLLKNIPDIYIFDGNGYLHPRHMGIATYSSFYLNKPTIGIAKTYYRINNTSYTEPNISKGSYTDIVIDNEIYGRVLRTQNAVKPIFLSVGNYISLNSVTTLSLSLTDKESHIPVPTRLADIETRVQRKIITSSYSKRQNKLPYVIPSEAGNL